MSDPLVNPQSGRNPLVEAAHPWIEHYEQGVPTELSVPDRPLTWLLDRAVSSYPGHTAFIYYGTKLSYAQLSSHTNRFASVSQRPALRKGAHVPLPLPTTPHYPTSFA